ncbi:PAAR domain-containing protein [Rosenbergiella epipactidis]|uniref:PAAR domain-containing protein n=1 Tax=Rosenbergiella epipactidis TaxID=1544694 RepID=UPI001BDB3992|nr:PAAR domain-containing protein [Rosenbergiella epipactidis]MBT0719527.1 PAAR domain-containing protein [Rosenbergiella epipactidis]
MLMARMGDATSHGGTVLNGLATVRCAGLPIALAATSVTSCALLHVASPITTGSTAVFATGIPVARVGDITGCGAQIVSGAANVFIRN